MTARPYREGRCAICRRPADDPAHAVGPRRGLLGRLLRLAWPRWLWGELAGCHSFILRDPETRAGEVVATLRMRRAHDRRRSDK